MRPVLRHMRMLLNRNGYRIPISASIGGVPLRVSCRQSAPSALFSHRLSSTGPAQQVETAVTPPANAHADRVALPRACPGCGAPAQIHDAKEAGYYNLERRAVRAFLGWNVHERAAQTKEDDIVAKALKTASPELLQELRLGPEHLEVPNEEGTPQPPVCERCHNLIHHHAGVPIHHPSVDSIKWTIAESPHRRNHIYHVLDAADFPLSIIPNLQSSLRIPKLRTQNRRAKHKGWVANDRIAEVSFIITRADLLAPKKEQVDVLLPYFTEVLRDALGRDNLKARLGNIRLVSAQRGWWTKQVKEDIWDRGGAGWMVGKVNVGKSNLFEAVFPKGRGADYQEIRRIRSAAEREEMLNQTKSLEELMAVQKQLAEEDDENERLTKKPQEHLHQAPEELEQPDEQPAQEEYEDPDALLPPPQPFTLYPVLPIASSLPGTTASPIRIPFGRNRGELVDLPGLARTEPCLETFVQPSEQDTLVMKHRMNSERYSLKPGQSLILGGGLIRITPVTQDLVFLVHPFVPIHPHVTRTEKAIAYQAQNSERQLQHAPILADDVGSKMRSAGIFALKWDVTKKLAGPMTSSVAGKMKPENLPFRIWGTDILLEGVGWIEVSAQTRRPQGWKPVGMTKKDPNHAQHDRRAALDKRAADRERKFAALARAEEQGVDPEEALREEFAADDEAARMNELQNEYPEVEVFSPLGKYIGQRRPMCASLVSGPKRIASRDRKARPRRSMVSVKRQRQPTAKS